MAETEFESVASAIQDFRQARLRGKLEQLLARLTGGSAELLRYEKVRRQLRATGMTPRGLQNIPIDAIVGTVDRYADFTRSFLPIQPKDAGRWARVKVAATGLIGLPPIEVYQIGEIYFVLDGNHRVSVAKQLKATHIQAYITEVRTKVSLSPDVQPDDLIVKAEYVEFLEHTRLDALRPDADLNVSAPGQYPKLEEHISVHRYFMGVDQERDVPYSEAVAHWYDIVYLPVVKTARDHRLLRDFPDRTETDLYLWISEHRATLAKELHWKVSPEAAAEDLVEQYSPRLERVLSRVGERILDAAVPAAITPGPAPGTWRQEREARFVHGGERPRECLFSNVLVAITGREDGWAALEHAIAVAQREHGQLLGLHVVSSQAELEGKAVEAARAEFDRRCERAGLVGRWLGQVGSIAPKICEWGRWSDISVVSLAHPPGDQPLARLESGFRAIVQRCPTPVLAVPPTSSCMCRALLAYDGSPKADEALFVSTYLAGQWKIPLVVLAVLEGENVTSDTLARARAYVDEHGVEATFVEERGAVEEAILNAARAHDSELIVMGGYGFSPVLEIVLGSAVDQVLRESQQPVLICR